MACGRRVPSLTGATVTCCLAVTCVRGVDRDTLVHIADLLPVILKAAPASGFDVTAKTSVLLRWHSGKLPLSVALQLLDGAFLDPSVRAG